MTITKLNYMCNLEVGIFQEFFKVYTRSLIKLISMADKLEEKNYATAKQQIFTLLLFLTQNK